MTQLADAAIVEIFHKNNKFTEGLQLEPGLWEREE